MPHLESIEPAVRSAALAIAARVLEAALNGDTHDYRGPAAACGTGFFARDEALRIGGGSLSEGVLRMVGTTASLVSFAETEELVRTLSGIAVGAKQVERAAEALGRDIDADERVVVECSTAISSTMYLGIDGTGLPMRQVELAGRSGKQPDGTAKTREAKLVTIWSADGCDKDGLPVRTPGSVSYNAAIESAATPDTADELSPGAIQIIDMCHAKGTLSQLAKDLFGPAGEQTEQWGKARRDELENGRMQALLRAIDPHLKTSKQARTCRDYLLANRDRLDYPRFRRMGLCNSSGVVEAGCKLAIGTRLKRAGMHWTVSGANAIMAPRAFRLSHRYDGYWDRRHAA